MGEKWLPVVGFEGRYEVSDHGRVRSLPRYAKVRGDGMRLIRPRILAPMQSGRQRRMRVTLSMGTKGAQVHPLVHRIVAEAFLGVPEAVPVRHRDGDEANNKLENLALSPTPSAGGE